MQFYNLWISWIACVYSILYVHILRHLFICVAKNIFTFCRNPTRSSHSIVMSMFFFQEVAVSMLLDMRPSLYLVVEQPAQSWGFKQEFILCMISALWLLLVLALACFELFLIILMAFFFGEKCLIYAPVSSSFHAASYYTLRVMFGLCLSHVHSFMQPGSPPQHGWDFMVTIFISVRTYYPTWPAFLQWNVWWPRNFAEWYHVDSPNVKQNVKSKRCELKLIITKWEQNKVGSRLEMNRRE